MKALYTLALIGLLGASAFAQGDTGIKWTRIEMANNEVSAVIPEGFLVNAEKDETTRMCLIYGFAKNASFSITISKDQNARLIFHPPIPVPQDDSEPFKVNGIDGKKLCVIGEKTASCFVHLGSNKYHYFFQISATESGSDLAAAFLTSILAGGKQIIKGANIAGDQTVKIDQLITSPEIKEALLRDPGKTELAFTQKPMAELQSEKKDPLQDGARPAIVLERPFPKEMISDALKPDTGGKKEGRVIAVDGPASSVPGRGFIARVKLLASGEIGDVIIFSDEKPDVVRKYAPAINKIKFVPAHMDGKAIDSVCDLQYTVPDLRGFFRF